MKDAIWVVGFGVKDVSVSAVIGPFVFTAVALIDFGSTVKTGNPFLDRRTDLTQ